MPHQKDGFPIQKSQKNANVGHIIMMTDKLIASYVIIVATSVKLVAKINVAGVKQ